MILNIMKKKILIQLQLSYLFSLIGQCYGKTFNITISNNSYNLTDVNNLLQIYSEHYSDINIILESEYETNYKGGISFTIPENVNLSIIGKPTLFTFNKNSVSNLNFEIPNNNKHSLTIENIYFKNFYNDIENTLLYIYSYSPDYNVLIKNCTFDGSNSQIIEHKTRYSIYNEKFNIIIDSCIFK